MDTEKKKKLIAFALAIVVVGIFGAFLMHIQKEADERKAKQEAYDNSIEGITEKMHFYYGAEDTASLAAIQKKLAELYPESAELDTVTAYLTEIRDRDSKLQAEWKKSFDKLKVEKDEFKGTTFYFNSYFTHNFFSNNVSLYIGREGDKIWPCARISYSGSDWIFFDEIIFLIDGQTWTFAFDKLKDRDTEVSGGSVAEWVNMGIDQYPFSFMASIPDSKEAKVRMSGKYNKDRTITQNERKAIRQVVEGYRYLLSTGCQGCNPF